MVAETAEHDHIIPTNGCFLMLLDGGRGDRMQPCDALRIESCELLSKGFVHLHCEVGLSEFWRQWQPYGMVFIYNFNTLA